MGLDLAGYLERCKSEVDRYLETCLPAAGTFPGPLFESMRYSLFAGGKRIRPAFAFAAAEAAGGNRAAALPFAAALEMIHTYSLIHDDLPAMDDDDLRRGKPTNHVVYGEGVAILAGDGLLTEAFLILTRPQVLALHPAERVVRAVFEIAQAAGCSGMVAGQTLDLMSEGKTLDFPTLEFLHARKTGALIRASAVVGGLAAGADQGALARLAKYGERVGLAFQIADDILDVEGATETLGKPVGSDRELAKATYPALLGMGEAKRRAQELVDSALSHLAPFGEAAEPLRALGIFVLERRY